MFDERQFCGVVTASNTEIEVIAPSLIHDDRSGRLAATNMIAQNASNTNSAVASVTTDPCYSTGSAVATTDSSTLNDTPLPLTIEDY